MNNLQFEELEMTDLFMIDGGGTVDDVARIGGGGSLVTGGCLAVLKGAAAKTVVVAGISMPGGLLVAAGVVGIAAGVTLIAYGVNSLVN